LNDHLWKIINFGTADIYLFFKPPLGENITESTNVPDLYIFRLADVFTSVTDQLQKDGILHAFTTNSQLTAIVAFVMGIDCPDVR
jgi:hypothetical protein